MLYGKYKNVRNSAWQALLDFNVTELPVSVNGIAKQLGIKVIKNSDIHELQNGERGATIFKNEHWYIVFDDTESVPVCRFTIAHEFAHILLGHVLINGSKYRTFEKRTEEEQEADMFAARLLAPACVLWGLNLHTSAEIATVCKVSKSAAKNRAERMEILYQRNRFLSSPLERQVYNQFMPYIKNHSQSGNFGSDNKR